MKQRIHLYNQVYVTIIREKKVSDYVLEREQEEGIHNMTRVGGKKGKGEHDVIIC